MLAPVADAGGIAAPAGTGQLARRLVSSSRSHFDLPAPTAFRLAAEAALRRQLPVMAVALCRGAAAVLLQTGFLISAAPLAAEPRPDQPDGRLRRLFSFESAIEAGKSRGQAEVVSAALRCGAR